MSELRPRPNLDQLRRQARELLRAATQHALARDYGFASWPQLKAEVERRQDATPSFLMRYVRTQDEVRVLWDLIMRILDANRRDERWQWYRMSERFEKERRTLLVLEHDGTIVGGTIRLSVIAVEPWAQGIGLGRRLWQTAEGEVLSAADELYGPEWDRTIGTHADPENIGFFLKLGYSGEGRGQRHMHKGVPAQRLLDIRLRRWRERVGDLEQGVVLAPEAATGMVPALPW